MKGRCLICGALGPLTRDHVPPQSVVPPQHVEVRRLLSRVSDGVEMNEPARRQFPSPSFPTLCKQCNGTQLGSEYDPYLAAFANAFRSWVNTAYNIGLTLPSSFRITLKPHRIARAVIGHLLATEERRDRAAPLNDAPVLDGMRRYFLNPSAVLTNAELYVWPYPSDEFVIVRFLGLARPGVHDLIMGDVLKFFPLAFWLVYDAPPNLRYPFPRLPLDAVGGLDHEVTLEVPLSRIPVPTWPERPSKNELVLTNSNLSHVGRPTRSGGR